MSFANQTIETVNSVDRINSIDLNINRLMSQFADYNQFSEYMFEHGIEILLYPCCCYDRPLGESVDAISMYINDGNSENNFKVFSAWLFGYLLYEQRNEILRGCNIEHIICRYEKLFDECCPKFKLTSYPYAVFSVIEFVFECNSRFKFIDYVIDRVIDECSKTEAEYIKDKFNHLVDFIDEFVYKNISSFGDPYDYYTL